MKISASPLVVAVALGLLGPLVLTPDSDDVDASVRDGDTTHDALTTPPGPDEDNAD